MMDGYDCENGVLYIGDHRILLKDLKEILDMIKNLKETKIVDVNIDGCDVICTFANGEKQTAHCHAEDKNRWSLETGISVCLGKYLTGGSNEYNRIIRQGVRIFRDKVKEEADRIKKEIEEERIRENKKRKRERYLKRRAERKSAKDLLSLINDLINDLGFEIDITVD